MQTMTIKVHEIAVDGLAASYRAGRWRMVAGKLIRTWGTQKSLRV